MKVKFKGFIWESYKMQDIPKKHEKISGVYLIVGKTYTGTYRRVLYVGQSRNFFNRCLTHSIYRFIRNVGKFREMEFLLVRAPKGSLLKKEKRLINLLNPPFNYGQWAKTHDPLISQVNSAIDVRCKRWVARKINIPVAVFSHKMTGLVPFTKVEINKLNLLLNSKIKYIRQRKEKRFNKKEFLTNKI